VFESVFILDGWIFNIIEIEMSHQMPIFIALCLTISNVTLSCYSPW
jgi:hypothetical protein